MKKSLLLLTAAASLFCTINAGARSTTATVKWVSVTADKPDSVVSWIPQGEQGIVGYNAIKNGSVALGYAAWGVNHIGFMTVDASDVEGTITKATLTMNVSGSCDNNRNTNWGIGYNSTPICEDFTYNKADRSITTIGDTYWTSTKSSQVFETVSFDITSLLTEKRSANLIVYETRAAGGYMKNPVVRIEYTPSETGNGPAKQNRGLWACKTVNGKNVFVSWRMRQTDDHASTTYRLYADNVLVATLTDRTNTTLANSYTNSTFKVEVVDRNGVIIDSQDGVTCDDAFFHHIKMDYPGDYTMPDETIITYTPNDASAYDMDGDGEQEIIIKWEPSNVGPLCTATAPQIVDCYKLDGTRLWRIDFGPNVLAGCRFTFLCYDFDGDGRGELIAKTAQGSKDATGNYLGTGVAAGVNHEASSVNSAGVITNGGHEWLTCFDGVTGKELQTIDYWPLFGIQSNWDDRIGYTDGADYGHRGNWFKGCVSFLDINGVATPCAVTVRGIYTYSYAAAYHWDGENLNVVWKHSSETKGQGIYGEGAHSITTGDMDGDGFDEIMVGAAALDHDGTTLWRTGIGHGDSPHLGEFDPDNEGLEVFMVAEETTSPYDAALLDAKTGKVLTYRVQTGGDTARGLAMDCDDNYNGAELMEWDDPYLMTCKGDAISHWHVGTTSSSSINYRIFWDGDLLEEYHDRSHVDKWNTSTLSWDRTLTFYSYGYGANSNNASKSNPCLQCDLYGDWREEAVYWATHDGDYYMTIFTTTTESDYMLPWLRDDHTYDMALAWQNCGYDQTPHLGYSPIEYFKNLESNPTGISSIFANTENVIGQSDVNNTKCDNVSYFDLAGRPVRTLRPGCYVKKTNKGNEIVIVK